jgi:Na+-translocating ferredoxin:NAD+ oxidoreductase RNF subunit RnfB
MTEPKKRGRPPKAKPEMNARVEGGDPVGCAECGQAVGHYDDCPVGMGVATDRFMHEVGEYLHATCSTVVYPRGPSPAQLYAERVWNGQSPEVHREERLRRVKLALDGQGLSMEGVEL